MDSSLKKRTMNCAPPWSFHSGKNQSRNQRVPARGKLSVVALNLETRNVLPGPLPTRWLGLPRAAG